MLVSERDYVQIMGQLHWQFASTDKIQENRNLTCEEVFDHIKFENNRFDITKDFTLHQKLMNHLQHEPSEIIVQSPYTNLKN